MTIGDEAGLQAAVLGLAAELGLVALHLRAPAREGAAWTGFPDLVIIQPGRAILFRELKAPGKQLTAGQKRWAGILAGQDYAIWRPADWHTGRIRAELEGLAGKTAPAGEQTPQQRLWRALTAAAAKTNP